MLLCRIREALRKQHHLADDVADTILASWRPGTVKQYDVYIRKFLEFCDNSGVDPHLLSIDRGLQFLQGLRSTGLQYSGLNTARSALSEWFKIFQPDAPHFGSNVLVHRFMKGVFNSSPPRPKYSFTWDVNLVLTYLETLWPHCSIPFLTLSKKLCMLLALTLIARGQTLKAIDIEYIIFDTKDGNRVKSVQIGIPAHLKTDRPGSGSKTYTFKPFMDRPRICVVSTLLDFLHRSDSHRNISHTTQLFISSKPPYKAVSVDTIRRWIKSILQYSNVDVSYFSAHSTRHAMSSAAMSSGRFKADQILSTAGWTNAGTFARHYEKQTVQPFSNEHLLLAAS